MFLLNENMFIVNFTSVNFFSLGDYFGKLQVICIAVPALFTITVWYGYRTKFDS